MSMDWVGVTTLVLGTYALLGGVKRVFQIFIFSVLFQAAAAIKVGGNTITPPHLLLAFLAATLMIRGGMTKSFEEAIRFPRPGFWLTLFAVWCAIAGVFLPRIFEGAFDVYPISPDTAVAFHPEPLKVSAGNVTQSLYVIGSLFVFLAVVGFCVDLRRTLVVCDALILFSAGNVFFATLDLLGYLAGHPDLLDPVHNAGYLMHTNEVVAGLHRISGTFSETAHFSLITLGSLPFVLMLFLNGYRTRVTLFLFVGQLTFLLISTSTTACVGLIAVITYVLVSCFLKLSLGRASQREALFVALAPLTAVAIAAVATFDIDTWNGIKDFFNVLVFDKSTSDSGMERWELNVQAVQSLLSTNGLGAGTGSIRASSFPVALVANAGIPGALLYCAFLFGIFIENGSVSLGREANMARESARAAVFGTLAAATISGALVDLGLLFFIFAALACSVSDNRYLAIQRCWHESRKSRSPDDEALPAHASPAVFQAAARTGVDARSVA